MANGWYESGLRQFANGSIDWVNDDIRACFIDTGVYSVDLVNHDFKDDLSGIVDDMAASLASKAVSGAGVLDSDNPTFTGVTGNTVEAIVVYKYNAAPASAALLFYIDQATANLPFTPNGSDVTIQVNASGWASL
jgi:hypothetical protein